ncbi:hypothetical protein AVEN_254006-1 [Araneus ventricosus]|uniref:Uncharacterized protein n=1 Tax=Araneus ventricosus TaxID=182803 RepID=A0A4Y2E880_ARAVE|nr:hypothetical protein AVEN_254006-1 [Araneus ventricosus]
MREVKVVKPHIAASPSCLNSWTKWPHVIFPVGAMANADEHHRSTLRVIYEDAISHVSRPIPVIGQSGVKIHIYLIRTRHDVMRSVLYEITCFETFPLWLSLLIVLITSATSV